MTINPQSAFRVSDGVVFRELDGEAVLLNLDSGLYFGLDPVGTRIWQLFAEHATCDAVLQRLAEEYDAPADVLRRDVDELLGSLLEKGLLVQER